MTDAKAMLSTRLARRERGWLDIRSGLHDFALINYALPAERLRPYIPTDRFEIVELELHGRALAMMSVVPFVDWDFHFRSLPFARFRFCQTNFRVYVKDRKSGEHAVWFFGTTLGSWTTHLARLFWKIPWHRARYRQHCDYDDHARRYREFRYTFESSWCRGRIELEDTGAPVDSLDGFENRDEMMLVLTHPVTGYFRRLDRDLGTYSVSHDLLEVTQARALDLYFSLFEDLGVLTPDEMQQPHSVLICPRTVFDIHMPPVRLGS